MLNILQPLSITQHNIITLVVMQSKKEVPFKKEQDHSLPSSIHAHVESL